MVESLFAPKNGECTSQLPEVLHCFSVVLPGISYAVCCSPLYTHIHPDFWLPGVLSMTFFVFFFNVMCVYCSACRWVSNGVGNWYSVLMMSQRN